MSHSAATQRTCATVTGIKDGIPLNVSSGAPTSSLIFLTDSPFCEKAQRQTRSINKAQREMQQASTLHINSQVSYEIKLTLPIMLPTSCKGDANKVKHFAEVTAPGH